MLLWPLASAASPFGHWACRLISARVFRTCGASSKCGATLQMPQRVSLPTLPGSVLLQAIVAVLVGAATPVASQVNASLGERSVAVHVVGFAHCLPFISTLPCIMSPVQYKLDRHCRVKHGFRIKRPCFLSLELQLTLSLAP